MDLIQKLASYRNPELSETLEDIKKCCLRIIWKNSLLPWFTNHDVSHSEEIIHLLGQLLEPIKESSDFLSEHELFILLASAYLHDIGMQCLKVDDITIENLTQIEYEVIRKRHAQESYHIILKGVARKLDRDDFHLPHIDEEYLPLIAKISKGHATGFYKEIIEEFAQEQTYAKNRPIRGRLLTSLLMIGDELDMQGKRVDFTKIAHYTLSAHSQVHWYKHHYVEFIEMKNGAPHLILKFPQNSHAYQELIQEMIEKKLKEQIEKVKPILRESTSGRLHLDENLNTEIRIDRTPTTRELPKDALRELRKMLGKDEPKISSAEAEVSEVNLIYPKPSPLFTGRIEKLEKFKEVLECSSIISIEGLGGIGKTEFAAKCLEDFVPKEKVVWFDCLQDSKLDALIDRAGFSEVIKGENKTELAKFSGFADLIERKGKIIFLDNFQEVMDDSFGKFLQFSERRLLQAKIILIAREHPEFEGVRIVPIKLPGLENDSIEYSKKIIDSFYADVTVSDHELTDVCDNLDGHPLAIELAIQLLHYGESAQDIIPKIVSLKGKSEELSRRLLDEIFNHPKSTELEKRFMLNFSVLRGKVDKKALHSILDGDDTTLYRLIDKHMITRTDSLYCTHPLVKEFCYYRLDNKKEVHKKTAEYFKTIRKEYFDPLLEEEIFYHLLQSGHFQETADLISEKGDKFILSGYTNSLKEKIDTIISKNIIRPDFFLFYGDIAQIKGDWKDASHCFDKAFSFPEVEEKISAKAYLKYGEMLYRQGEVKESLSYFEDSCKICKKIPYPKGEARSLNDIGLVYKTFGNLSQAEGKINEALQIYKDIDDLEGIATSLNNIGSVLHSKGDLKGALDKHNESLAIRKEIGDKSGIAGSLNNIVKEICETSGFVGP